MGLGCEGKENGDLVPNLGNVGRHGDPTLLIFAYLGIVIFQFFNLRLKTIGGKFPPARGSSRAWAVVRIHSVQVASERIK